MSYSSSWMLAGTNQFNDNIGSGADANYTITNFQIDSLVLSDGTDNIDVLPAQPASSYWWNWASSVDLTVDNDLYISMQAYDPFNNEQDEDNYPFGGGTDLWLPNPNGASSMLTTNAQVDIGALTSPAASEYSDIVVKNDMFTRVGEIGRVASYYPGRSLRLWAASLADETGTDTYLLDLFKVGSTVEKRGRVNVNSLNTDV